MKFKSFTKPNDNQNSKDDEIRELMKDLLTDKYEKGFEWKGYQVYEPVYSNDLAIGEPTVVLVKGDEVRYSTPEESFEYLKFWQQQKGIKGDE